MRFIVSIPIIVTDKDENEFATDVDGSSFKPSLAFEVEADTVAEAISKLSERLGTDVGT